MRVTTGGMGRFPLWFIKRFKQMPIIQYYRHFLAYKNLLVRSLGEKI